jgi:NADPH:quinone reductase-like Zn-dependent oxidoreductase
LSWPPGRAAGPSRAEGLDELGADASVDEIEAADGQFDLTLESVGGKSLEAAVRLIVPSGTIAVYGNSSDTTAQISFGDFRGRAGARIEAFFVDESGEPPTFGEDLQRLAGMVAESWFAEVASRRKLRTKQDSDRLTRYPFLLVHCSQQKLVVSSIAMSGALCPPRWASCCHHLRTRKPVPHQGVSVP